jgi:2-keto-4-pentenoate hydratase/2-oxohepta-3-ene-1,7-dioic acid hydratase in catechol pathway
MRTGDAPASRPESAMNPGARPGKIVCVGRNYLEHARELGNEVPKEPLLFLKPPSSVIGDGAPIVLPPASKQVEYEGEIGIVIGTSMHDVDEKHAVRGIRGIRAVNDVTARDLQKTDGQWTRAKGFDSFAPLGPERARDPTLDVLEEMTVVTRVNGLERQRGSSSQMAFSISALLAYISRIMTLEPGDLVATGTPAGVGPLSDGDVVEVEVVGWSAVRNPVIAQRR